MTKKLSLFLASIAVTVLAVPAFAHAAPALTSPPGELLKPKEKIQSTGTKMVVGTSVARLDCSTINFTSEVVANSGSTFRSVEAGGSGSASGCTGKTALGPRKPIIVTDVTVSEIHSGSLNVGTMNIKFIADEVPTESEGSITCFFSSENAPYFYTSGTDVIKFINANLKAEPPMCEPGFFSAEFTLEKDGTELPIILD